LSIKRGILKKISIYKHNHLLIFGAALLCCTTLVFLVISLCFEDKIKNLSKLDTFSNFKSFVFSALLIAPIIEEFVFRGYFTQKKVMIFISLIGSIIYVVITENYYLLSLISLLIILHFFKSKKDYFYILSCLFFSVVHYKLKDFGSFFTILPMFFQFSLGAILIWVVINFGILKSIIFHFIYNLIIVIIISFPLLFPNKEIKSKQYIGYKIEWQKVSIFKNNTSIIKPNDYTVIAHNITINDFYKTFRGEKDKILININEKFYKFRFNVQRVDSTSNELNSETIKTILKQIKLIE
jgi:membrane protease YdiL (CAAX protease family)